MARRGRPKGAKNKPKDSDSIPRLPEFVASGVGTAERLQHGDLIVRDKMAWADDFGQFAHPFRSINILERWSKGNAPDITPSMRTAGEAFRLNFRIAHFDQMRAASMNTPVGCTAINDLLSGRQHAIDYVDRILNRLGGVNSPAGSCVWYVLGEGLTLHEWATRCGWSGRYVYLDAAKGVLIAALGVIAGEPVPLE